MGVLCVSRRALRTCTYHTAWPRGAPCGLKAVVRQQLGGRVSGLLAVPAHSLWTVVAAGVRGPVHCSTCMHGVFSAPTHACGVPTPPLFSVAVTATCSRLCLSQVGSRLLLQTPLCL